MSEAHQVEQRRAVLAAAFEISPPDVAADGETMRTWLGPSDDLLATICKAHAWQSELGAVYLAHLRHSLDPSRGPLPWSWR